MKKIIVVMFSILLLVGCSMWDSPTKAVEKLFNKYQALDEDVLSDLEIISESGTFATESLKKDYIKALKLQYSDLKYEILDEDIIGDEAVVKVKVTVYDFYKVQKDADEYLVNHRDEFTTDGLYDNNKFMEYKLKEMLKTSLRVEYTIDLDVTKESDKWVVEEFSKEVMDKIHCTYNYERD